MATNSKIKLNMDSLRDRKEWKRHPVKDGHNVYRILPPFGEASNGYPFRKWQLAWLPNQETGKARPIASSMTAEKRCPITEYVDQLKVRAETMIGQLKAAGISEDEINTRLANLQKLIGDIIPKTVYIYNAVDKSGTIGLLELKSTAHKAMKARMNEYINDYNQDPTSLNSADDDSGVWFDVVRTNETGKFRDTKYEVKKVQSKVKNASGGVSFVDDRSPLPDSVVENYDSAAYDLSTIHQVRTYEQLQELLEAHMPKFIELCPDADLSVEPTLTAQATKYPHTSTKEHVKNKLQQSIDNGVPYENVKTVVAGASKVALKLSDADDEEDAPAAKTSAKAPAKVLAAASTGDDFMDQADAILNS